jgi:hypothetical protein
MGNGSKDSLEIGAPQSDRRRASSRVTLRSSRGGKDESTTSIDTRGSLVMGGNRDLQQINNILTQEGKDWSKFIDSKIKEYTHQNRVGKFSPVLY